VRVPIGFNPNLHTRNGCHGGIVKPQFDHVAADPIRKTKIFEIRVIRIPHVPFKYSPDGGLLLAAILREVISCAKSAIV
jgi:hypothetical protein